MDNIPHDKEMFAAFEPYLVVSIVIIRFLELLVNILSFKWRFMIDLFFYLEMINFVLQSCIPRERMDFFNFAATMSIAILVMLFGTQSRGNFVATCLSYIWVQTISNKLSG